jgi:hypothetical protein
MSKNKELQNFIEEKSVHLKFNKNEYEKRVSYTEVLYRNGIVANQSTDFAYFRVYCSNLITALNTIEEQIALGRTIDKSRSRQQGIYLDLYFTKAEEETTSDLNRLSLGVKDKYKAELAAQRKVLITELTTNFEKQLQDAASKEATDKMNIIQKQLSEMFK